MATRPCIVSTRVKAEERRLIEAAATAEGVSIAELLHRLIVPGARERLAHLAEDGEREEVPA